MELLEGEHMSRRSGNISGASQAPKVPGDDVGSSAPMPEPRLQEATTGLQQPSSVDPFLIIVLTNDPHLTEEQLRLVRAEVRRGVHRKKKRLPKVNTASLSPKPSHLNRNNQVASAQSALSMSKASELQKYSAHDLQPFRHRMSSSVIDLDAQTSSTRDFAPLGSRMNPGLNRTSALNPDFCLWHPDKSVPLPSAHTRRSFILEIAQTVPYISKSIEYLEFKGEMVKWINSRLGDSRKALSDMTIGIILGITNWEISRANIPEVEHHLNGIQKIVQLRGGIEKLPMIRQFRTKVALVDMLVAALNNSKPRFPPFFEVQPRIPLPHMQGIDGNLILESPLYGNKPLDQVFRGSPFGEHGVQILQRMRDMTNVVLDHTGMAFYEASGTPVPDYNIIRVGPASKSMISSMNTFRGSSTEEENEQSLLPQSPLTPLIHAANIYTAVLSPLLAPSCLPAPLKPFSTHRNLQSLKALVQALQIPANDSIFVHYPGLMIWILLVAAVAAEGRDERGFLVMFLMRVGSGSVHGYWKEMRESIERFRRIRELVG